MKRPMFGPGGLPLVFRRKPKNKPKVERTFCTRISRIDGVVHKCRNKARPGSTRCHVHSPPPPERVFKHADIWSGITKTPEGGGDTWGYCTHAFDVEEWDHILTPEQKETMRERALCGVRLSEFPGADLTEPDWFPGCLKCQKKLVKLGLITQAEIDSGKRVWPPTTSP